MGTEEAKQIEKSVQHRISRISPQRVRKAKADLQGKFTKLEETTNALTKQVYSLRKELGQAKKTISSLERENEALRKNARVDTVKIKQFEKVQSEMATEMEALKAKITMLEKEGEKNRKIMQQTEEEK